MRILALTNLYPNPWQPHRAPFNRNELRILAKQHEVRVIAPIAWTDEWSARRRGGAVLPRGRRHIFDNILVEHPRYYFPPRMLRGWYGRCYRWSVRRAFREALEQFRPDVVYTPWAYPDGWAAVELGHRAGLPVVIKVHGSDVLLLSRTPGRRRGTVDALQRADRIVAVSQDLADRMVDLGVDSGKIEVVYDGLDLEVFRPGSKADARARLGLNAEEPMALFVGNLLALKGVEVLLEACARLKTEGLRFTCRLFGQGPMRTRLELTIHTKKLEDCVHLHGCLTNEQLPDWYRAADVFVLPSYSEGVPNVLLETAACGTPFVASRVGGIPEIAELGVSRLVPPGDVAQLAAALGDFLKGAYRPRPADAPCVRPRTEAVAQLSRLLEETVNDHSKTRSFLQAQAIC
jgi:glycosyltransferase involved in cell wall biosynthesis